MTFDDGAFFPRLPERLVYPCYRLPTMADVDDATVLGEDDLRDVISAVTDLVWRWKDLGISLRVRPSDLNTIQANNPHSSSDCLREMLALWLRQGYNVKKFGKPTWKRLVEAVEDDVGGNNRALAQTIARDHPGEPGTYSWVAVAVAVLLLLVVCMWILEFYQAVTAGVGVLLAAVIGKYGIQRRSMPDGKIDETRKPKIQHHCPEKGQESTDPAESSLSTTDIAATNRIQQSLTENGTNGPRDETTSQQSLISPNEYRGVYSQVKANPPLVEQFQDLDIDEDELIMQTHDIQDEFNTLFTRICMFLVRQDVTVDDLILYLEGVPGYTHISLFHSEICNLQEASNLTDVFRIARKYCSWFNHSFLGSVIRTFCRDSEEIKKAHQEYLTHFEKYCNYRVKQCPLKNGLGHGREECETLIMKVDRKWDEILVKELEEVTFNLARIIDVPEHTLYLCSVENGCVQLTFLVPIYIPDAVFPLTPKQETSMRDMGVINLQCGTYHFPSQASVSQPMMLERITDVPGDQVENCLSIDLWDPHRHWYSDLHDLFGASSSSGYTSLESSISSDLWNMGSEDDEVEDMNLMDEAMQSNVEYKTAYNLRQTEVPPTQRDQIIEHGLEIPMEEILYEEEEQLEMQTECDHTKAIQHLTLITKKHCVTQRSTLDTNSNTTYRKLENPYYSRLCQDKEEEVIASEYIFSLPQYIRVMVSNYQPLQTILAISKGECHKRQTMRDEQFSPTVTIVDSGTQQPLDCALLLHGEKPPEVTSRTLFCYIAVQVQGSNPHPPYHMESKPCKQGKLPLIFCFHQPGTVCVIRLSIHSIVDSEGVEYMYYSENCDCIVEVVGQDQHQCYSGTQHGVVRVKEPPLLSYIGPLASKRYHTLEEQFTKMFASGSYEWIQLLSEQTLVSSVSADIQVVALCWEALSMAVHRNYWHVDKLLKTAWQKASQLECENGLLLQGRILRHLAVMQYNYGNDDEALEYVSGAKERLFNAAPSEETALTLHTELVVKRHRCILSSQQYESAVRDYDLLLEHAKYMEEHKTTVVWNFFTMKASFHLRSDLITSELPPEEYWPSPEDLRKAEECLKRVSLYTMPSFYRARYLCTLCDLYIWKNHYSKAMHYLEIARNIGTKSCIIAHHLDQRLKLLRNEKTMTRLMKPSSNT